MNDTSTIVPRARRTDQNQWQIAMSGTFLTAAAVISLTVNGIAQDSRRLPSGNAEIRAAAGDSEIVITTTARLAGAIHSLTWKGKEFINSEDHGRQLQSASNFDAGSSFTPETFNPTEAGSVQDGAGSRSTSQLLQMIAKGNHLQTTTRMAFWLTPQGNSQGHPAKNTTALSEHLLTKRVQIGYDKWPHVIQYDVTFSLPLGERHTYAQFEVVTGYMPPDFEIFWGLNPQTGNLMELTDGPGEQPFPVILATRDKAYAMGILARDATPGGMTGPGYGRFRFRAEKVVKWNSVYRLQNKAGVPAADYSFRQFVIVGDLITVKQTMQDLIQFQQSHK